MAEVVGRELQFPTVRSQLKFGGEGKARVVDEQVQRPAPAPDEGCNRRSVGEVQRHDVDGGVAGCRDDVGGGPATGVGVAHREGDLGASTGEGSRGLGADSRRAAGHDRALPGEVDGTDHLGGGRGEPERRANSARAGVG